MCEKRVLLGLLAATVAFANYATARLAPDFIHPCNSTLSACLIQATQDAIPEFSKGLPRLGVPSLDPFIIEELPIQLPGVKVTFLDGKVSGLRKCQVLNVEAYLEKNVFILEIRCNITIKGKYTAVGRLLLFPINGEGDSKIKIVNSVIKLNIKTKYFKDADGRDHFGIKNYKYTFDYGDRVHYTINNLFKGNPELSNTVLQFLNENWRVVTEEFGQPVVEYAMNVTIETARKFFNAVPYDELLHVPIPKY
ncbi:circadian clock-controlled protein daywake-like [Maniola hyperantus]|uniref:circadian clock-controlled protein daywake-like n=1 Tax=Aphantopus hyperantus TaxID=2795564 RepID=UPI0015690748|nr:circadian clock-controlled protein-like [Maniola hyperantus]